MEVSVAVMNWNAASMATGCLREVERELGPRGCLCHREGRESLQLLLQDPCFPGPLAVRLHTVFQVPSVRHQGTVQGGRRHDSARTTAGRTPEGNPSRVVGHDRFGGTPRRDHRSQSNGRAVEGSRPHDETLEYAIALEEPGAVDETMV